ncbi:MAG: SUMF1/EgtB/PvdO family nonheme iron enzyme [Verrucomicrobia bacterium]|nr:SUMF1/EgtB/PvdO family nonheme iron enzyme [Verrucomicrobiota bacterium]
MQTHKLSTMTAALALGLGLATTDRLRADTFGSGANTFTIDFMTIGNPGNADDSGTTGLYSSPYGGVAYSFQMGMYEVSRDMVTKANAEGGLGITLPDMSVYGANGPNRPATGVSWNETARFVNWLNTSKGYSPAYKFSLQPGEGGYSVNADILLWTSGDTGYDASNPYRNANAAYFLPSEDEWYKAAFYSGSGTTYYDYALGSDSIPASVTGGASGAVYNLFPPVGPTDIDNAGGSSPYGTVGQNGNVWELTESAADGLNSSVSENRAIRGGYWVDSENTLRSSYQRDLAPSNEINDGYGFRVASVPVPEPSTAALMFAGVGAWLLKRRRK